ncbi:hypothetical protein L211DRAFT_843437 [Terfezia boudieri ATCC MYA-4762]|uniref:Uncharacterized protein n=1 Tax=Terfezia boudieri ATCC MYA-4762 TaxID=1051890 RepID=A0A3N4L6W3_9PEZI|nr:hypothetical protein L211DRAFT_843437 [Terfezia boudieri ATCC MYA-4762]
MSVTNEVPPTLDEMIFAISQINYNTVCRPLSPPPPSTDRLSASLDNIIEPSPTKTLTNADTDASVIDDDTDVDEDEDNSENEEDNDEENRAMSVSSELDSSRWHPAKKSKHLVLLDLLALLLVTEAKSDVAATMLRTNGSMKFFYSKNRPFTDSENQYVRTLFNYASETNRSVADRYSNLLAAIVDKCQKKIMSRISKVLRRVRELSTNWGIHSEDHLPLELVEKLKAKLGIGPEQSLRNRLISWLDSLSSAQRLKDPEFLRRAIVKAHAIGIPSYINLLIDQKLLRRIRKLGGYMGAVIQLVGEVDLLPPQVLQTLVIQEVPPPPPDRIVIEKTSVEIVEQWARNRHIEEPTETNLRIQFPSLPQPLSQQNTITRSVHCECTLIMNIIDDLVQQGTSPFVTLEIGVSKSLCNLCEVFMGSVKKRYPNITIMVSTHHGKNVSGWRLPPLTPLEISREVEDHINSCIEEIRCKATQERRSDSEPRVVESAFGEEAADFALRFFYGTI